MELYKIDFENGKSYIGITSKTTKHRIKQHLKDARSGKKQIINNALRKFNDFKVTTLVIANNWEWLCNLEKLAISAFNTLRPNGYNVSIGGDQPALGYKFSEEAKKKMSDQRKGKKIHNDDSKRRISESAKGNKRGLGRKKSEEEINQMRQRMKGNTFSLGLKRSDKTKLNMSLAAKNRSEENKKIISDTIIRTHLGAVRSNETKRKLSEFAKNRNDGHLERIIKLSAEANKGKKRSSISKARASVSMATICATKANRDFSFVNFNLLKESKCSKL